MDRAMNAKQFKQHILDEPRSQTTDNMLEEIYHQLIASGDKCIQIHMDDMLGAYRPISQDEIDHAMLILKAQDYLVYTSVTKLTYIGI